MSARGGLTYGDPCPTCGAAPGQSCSVPHVESYNGHPSRESWALWLYATNTEPVYRTLIDYAEGLPRSMAPRQVGEACASALFDWLDFAAERGSALMTARDARMALADIGSRWRVDHLDLGQNVRELLAEVAP